MPSCIIKEKKKSHYNRTKKELFTFSIKLKEKKKKLFFVLKYVFAIAAASAFLCRVKFFAITFQGTFFSLHPPSTDKTALDISFW